ncbi:hypothetical protein F4604DRAFT_1680521 [Suillus subluteus]|nr:hypothetical protein F4604DRAFT_1680521 [Suillus subluteus]
MAPPRWTSAEQLMWLQNEVPMYLQMQKDKKLVQFFELLYPKWFRSEKSPDDNDTNINQSSLDSDAAINEIIAKLDHENAIIPISDVEKQSDLDPELAEKLQEWFRNNTKGKTRPGGTLASKVLSTMLGQCARGTRDLKEVEVYSQLHYESKVKPLVSEDIRENKLALPDQRLCAVRHHTSECFAKESEDVKDVVCVETQCINTARKLGSVAAGDDRTKEEIYRTIQELPIVLGQIFEELSTLTGGWHYSLVMGGPDPFYHHGKTPDGLSFKASTPNFHEQYLLPFKKHLDHIYGGSSKGTSAPTSIPSTPLSTTNLILTSGRSSPPFFATDLTLPDDLLDQQHASNVGLPLPQRPAHFEDISLNTVPQLNRWQGGLHPDLYSFDPAAPIHLDSPITTWQKEFVSGENLTMSTALPQVQEPFTLPQFSFPDNANLLPTHDLSLTDTTPLLHLHQPSPVVFSTQPSPPLSLPLLPLLLPSPEPSLPLAISEPSLPLTMPGPSLPLATPRPSLPLASPEPSLPLTLLKPSLLLPPPKPSMPLASPKLSLPLGPLSSPEPSLPLSSPKPSLPLEADQAHWHLIWSHQHVWNRQSQLRLGAQDVRDVLQPEQRKPTKLAMPAHSEEKMQCSRGSGTRCRLVLQS